MSITCPYCGHTIKLRSARAGSYRPRCTRCGQAFQLTVRDDAGLSCSVAPLPDAASAEGGPEATVPGVQPIPPRPPAPDPASRPAAKADVTATSAGAAANDSDFSVAPSAVALAQPAETLPATDLVVSGIGESPRPIERDEEMPSVLGNYQILERLGRGGMGAVYRARQMSLDRLVALKVMNPQWAKNPAFLVRFTREAYAAAQLVHHNVVQVYDIGADRGINYFSMEFVQGQSLGDLLKKEKKLDPATAAGYVLQAARGLKFAHDRGMIHRDIKPDNLMLNDQGVVKVADLGLVRTPGMADERPIGEEAAPPALTPGKNPAGRSLGSLSNVTMAGQAMGTPPYMSPEQARDATRVDHRADIYSLGCTLYVLVTGRPVFQGASALEVITRHASDPVIRPDAVVKEVPRGLGDIILKMLAKRPDDRYASMAEVIKALEDFLGLHGAGKAAATEQHLRALEQGVKAYQSASGSALRSYLLLGFFGGCALLFLLLLLLGRWRMAGGVLGLGGMTALAYFVVSGLTEKGPLFRKARDLVLSASWLTWLKFGGGLLLALGVLWLLGLLGWFLAAAVLAVPLAVGVHFALDRKVAARRAEATEKVERLLKALRLRGLSEEAVQEFVAVYAGDHWEEFFEALFGYESKLAARALHGKGPKGARPKFAAWRDPLIRWIDDYQRARREAKERRHLQRIERANLVAQGVEAGKAEEQAEAVAVAMVQVAADLRQQPAPVAVPVAVPVAAIAPEQGAPEPPVERTLASPRVVPPRRVQVQEMFEVTETPRQASARRAVKVPNVFGALFGGGMRFLVGAALLLIALFWLHSRELLPGASNAEEGWRWAKVWAEGQTAEPLAVPGVPEVVPRALCSLGAAVAGVVLLLSSIWKSWKIGFAVLLGAAVMVVGPVTGHVPELGPLTPPMVCLAAGGVLAGLGFLFGRDT